MGQASFHVVSEKDLLFLEDVLIFEFIFKLLFNELDDIGLEPFSVILGRQSIVENTHTFVNPEADHDHLVVAELGACH